MPARRPLPLLTISFALGILIAVCAAPLIWCVGAALLLALLLYGVGRRTSWLTVAALCSMSLLGVVRYRASLAMPQNDISRLAPAVVTVTGVVRTYVEFPPVSPQARSPHFGSGLLAVRQVEIDSVTVRRRLNVTGNVLLRVPIDTVNGQSRQSGALPHVGEVVRAYGRLELPPDQRNPGGFDERARLARGDVNAILTILRRSDWRVVGREWPLSDMLFATLRHAVIDHMRHALTREQAGVTEGLLIGTRVDLPHRVKDDFERTGMMHLLATAGLHVGVLAALLFMLWRSAAVPLRPGVLLTINLLFVYAAVANGRPSVTRAAIMAGIVLFGKFIEREPDLPNALSLAAFALLLYDPRNLSDPGFQLSFATVVTILLLLPLAEDLLRRIGPSHRDSLPGRPGIRWLKRGGQFVVACLLVTMAAEGGAALLVAYYFNGASLVAPWANLLVIPITPLWLACGCGGVVAGALFAPLAIPFDFATGLFADYSKAVAHYFAELPWATIPVMSPPLPLLVAYYATVWGAAWSIRRALALRSSRVTSASALERQLNAENVETQETLAEVEPTDDSDSGRFRVSLLSSRTTFALIPLLVIGGHLLLFHWNALSRRHDGELRVTFLDVGQGDSAVIETPGGHTIVVDAGGVGTGEDNDEGEWVVAPFLRHLGIGRIDALILTHPHADHIGGAPTLLRRFQVDQLIDNGQVDGDPELSQVLKAAQERGVPHHAALPGRTLDCGDGVTVEELAPNEAEVTGAPNNASVALRVSYGRTAFLLTGDAEASEESDLLHNGSHLACDVLKVGHHGSRTSTTPEFLAAAHPRWAVISVGEHNLYGHPNAEVISRLQTCGTTVYRTDLNGAITFLSDGMAVRPLPLHQAGLFP